MNSAGGLVTVYLLVTLVQYVDALNCYKCNRTEQSCRDEVFQEFDQPSVECGDGSCITVKYDEDGQVDRYCDLTRHEPGCSTLEDRTICACDHKDNCNGPVDAVGAKEGDLQCYVCSISAECDDEVFHKGQSYVLVDCGSGSCIKTKFKDESVERQCSSTRLPAGCVDQTDDKDKAVICACHDKNGCNTATRTRQTLFNYILVFFLLYLA